MAVLYVFCKAISILLSLVSSCMFLRFILSFFYMDEGPRFYVFICAITEVFIVPIRALLQRFGIGEGLPIDIAFSLTYLLLVMAQAFLPVL
ncbi:MAG: YggT family protein [Clostridia bacterium]|nr:YggT family protein [Clostridia bacterium]